MSTHQFSSSNSLCEAMHTELKLSFSTSIASFCLWFSLAFCVRANRRKIDHDQAFQIFDDVERMGRGGVGELMRREQKELNQLRKSFAVYGIKTFSNNILYLKIIVNENAVNQQLVCVCLCSLKCVTRIDAKLFDEHFCITITITTATVAIAITPLLPLLPILAFSNHPKKKNGFIHVNQSKIVHWNNSFLKSHLWIAVQCIIAQLIQLRTTGNPFSCRFLYTTYIYI